MANAYESATSARIFSQIGAVELGDLGAVPVIEDSVTVNTGEVDKTEIKLINGTVWTSKTSKGDSDVSFQIPALDDAILAYFFGTKNTTDQSYSLAVNQKTDQDVKFIDSDGKDSITFKSCEVYGSLVLGDGDNPGYINVVVTIKDKFIFATKTS